MIDLGIEGLTDYRRIGRGGFATVYAAQQVTFNRRVAVKVLDELDAGGLRRFNREQVSMGTVDEHPNIVTPFSSGYTRPDNRPYLIMEYLSGGSLQDRLDNHGSIRLDEAITLILPIAEALGHSHSSGLLHKDVKPANILVSGTGVVKLTDFGIAALRGASSTTSMAFSLSCSPPETFRQDGQDDLRDERSDLYSLAATLYALVSGQALFESRSDNSPAGYIGRILAQPVPLTGHRSFDAFLATALAKDPAQRYSTAAQFISALRAVAQPGPNELGTLRPLMPAPGSAPVTNDETALARQRPGPGGAVRWFVALIGGSIGALAVAGLVVSLLTDGNGEDGGTADGDGTVEDEGTVEDGGDSTGQPVVSFVENRLDGTKICTATWDPAGDRYAVTGQGTGMQLYDGDGSVSSDLGPYEVCPIDGQAVQWAPSGQSLAVLAGSPRGLFVIDPADGTSETLVDGPGDGELSIDPDDQISWNADESMLSIASFDGIDAYDIASGTPRRVRDGLFFAAAFHPTDANLMAIGTRDGTLYEVIDIESGEVVASGGTDEAGSATYLVWSPDATSLAIGIEDWGVEIWDWNTGSRVATLDDPDGVITDIRWTPNGHFLSVTSHDEQLVHVYDASSDEWPLIDALEPQVNETERVPTGVSAGSVNDDGTALLAPQGELGIDVYQIGS